MFDNLVRTASIFVTRNSTTILTAFGVAGVLSTAVLAVRATPSALRELEIAEVQHPDNKLTPLEIIKAGYKPYIPAVVVGGVTIACIIGAHSIGTRKNAALASAYTLVNRAFSDYKGQVFEQFGERKAQAVQDAVSDQQIKEGPNSLVILGDGNVLCWESLTGRYFESTPEKLRRAENTLNARMNHGADYGVQLNEFYSLVGLEQTKMGDDLGWNIDTLIELGLSSHLTPDEKPCLAVTYKVSPYPNYWQINSR